MSYIRNYRKPYILTPSDDVVLIRMVAHTGKTIRVPLTSLRAVYEGPGRIGPHGVLPRDEDGFWDLDRSLSLLSGIRITAEKEPMEVLDYLNEVKKKFVLRGRARRQISFLFGRFAPAIEKRVVYAACAYATHRVLVYRYFGKAVREYSYEDPDGEVQALTAYESNSYQIFPLARVDVLPPLKYLSGRYPNLQDFRDAVNRSAERIACLWFEKMSSTLGMPMLDRTSSGWGASVISRLQRKDQKTISERIWKTVKQPNKQIGNGGALALRKLGVRTDSLGSATINSIGGE